VLPDSNANASTAVSPAPKSTAKGITGAVRGERIVIHYNSSGMGRFTPCARPADNSRATAGGTTTRPANAGSKSSKPSWCKYWRGDVLQTISGKRRLLPEFFLG
jgi:hypothetical protein